MDDIPTLYLYAELRSNYGLLEDYFYGNLEKVAMILGTKFIEKEKTLTSRCLLDNADSIDLPDKTIWRIADLSTLSEDDFKGIIKQ